MTVLTQTQKDAQYTHVMKNILQRHESTSLLARALVEVNRSPIPTADQLRVVATKPTLDDQLRRRADERRRGLDGEASMRHPRDSHDGE